MKIQRIPPCGSFHISLLGVKFVDSTMENSDHDISESSYGEADQKVEALDLLEESWFFENLFNRRRRMLRCYSDPCTSSNFSQEVSAKDSCSQSSESAKKFHDKGSVHCSLIRTPSLPPCIGMEEKVQERKSSGGRSKLNRQLSLQASKATSTEKIDEIQEKKTDRKSKLSGQSWRSNLLKIPSLPTSIGRKELIQDNDSDISMGKLIRQALANSSDILPPRHSPNKVLIYYIILCNFIMHSFCISVSSKFWHWRINGHNIA